MNFLDDKLPERFWSKVHPEPMSGCWLWTAGIDPQGYGHYKIRTRKDVLAHRISFEAATGAIDSTLVIDHRCTTPSCVNPAHLQQVTSALNTALRRVRSNRCRHGHEYTPENTTWRPRHGRPGTGQMLRVCKRCEADAQLRYKKRKSRAA